MFAYMLLALVGLASAKYAVCSIAIYRGADL